MFDIFIEFFNFANSLPPHILNMGDNAYFLKSTLPRSFSDHFNTLQICYRHIEEVHVEVL